MDDVTPPFPRQSRAPVFNMPGIVTGTLVVLLGIHALRAVLPAIWDITLLLQLAFIPARWTAALDPARAAEAIQAVASATEPGLAAARQDFVRAIVSDADAMPWTFVSYGLLHGSWTHVIFNVVWLAAFGTPVARRYGSWRFGILAVAGVVAGAVLHLLLDPLSAMPLVGASAGISALMAAAARFVFQPPPPASQLPWQLPPRPRLQSLSELLRNRSALVFLGVWLLTNLLFGVLALPLGAEEGPIAWDAHLGGFAVGFFLLPFLEPRADSRMSGDGHGDPDGSL